MPSLSRPFSAARALFQFPRRIVPTAKLTPIYTRPIAQPRSFLQPRPFLRFNSHSTASELSSRPQALSQPSNSPKPHAPRTKRSDQPAYEMTFTCKPCSTRSTHRVSKQGYHYGSVLITCPECKNRHVISDHLGIFGDTSMTIEDLMRERGQLVKKGTLSEDGNLEFWDDGSTTKRRKTVDTIGKNKE